MISLRFKDSYSSDIASEFESFVAQLKAWALVSHEEDGSQRTDEVNLGAMPLAAMLDWPTDTAPTAWRLCNGDAVSRATYEGLFRVIGTTFGVGDGSTTFNLPDARGRFALSKANAGTGNAIGGTGGNLDHTHTTPAHLHGAGTLAGPSHTHTGPSHTHGPGTLSTGGPSTTDTTTRVDPPTADVEFGLHTHTHSVTGGVTAADGTGATGASGTGAVTGSTANSVAGTSGTGNPAYIVLGHKIIYTGVA